MPLPGFCATAATMASAIPPLSASLEIVAQCSASMQGTLRTREVNYGGRSNSKLFARTKSLAKSESVRIRVPSSLMRVSLHKPDDERALVIELEFMATSIELGSAWLSSSGQSPCRRPAGSVRIHLHRKMGPSMGMAGEIPRP